MRNFQDMLQTPTWSQGHVALDGGKHNSVPEKQHPTRSIKNVIPYQWFFICMIVPLKKAKAPIVSGGKH